MGEKIKIQNMGGAVVNTNRRFCLLRNRLEYIKEDMMWVCCGIALELHRFCVSAQQSIVVMAGEQGSKKQELFRGSEEAKEQ